MNIKAGKIIVFASILGILVSGVYYVLTINSGDVLNTSRQALDQDIDQLEMLASSKLGNNGTYANFTGDLPQEDDQTIVLFFHASWCPTCRILDQNLEAGSIPDDLNILQVNYDTESSLKKKYGVTYQHTLVQIDKNGNMLKTWGQSRDITDIIEQVI